MRISHFQSPESLELASLEPVVGVCSQGQVAGGVGGLLEPVVGVGGGGKVAEGVDGLLEGVGRLLEPVKE